jgi:hypothetical protein
MAYETPSIVITLEAAANLSTNQYRFVKVTAAQTCNAIAATTDSPVGVQANKPSAAPQATEIWVTGIAKVEVGVAGLNAGDHVAIDSVGRGVTATTGQAYGIALATGVSGDVVSVLLGIRPYNA